MRCRNIWILAASLKNAPVSESALKMQITNMVSAKLAVRIGACHSSLVLCIFSKVTAYHITIINIMMNVNATTRANEATPEQYVNSAKVMRTILFILVGLQDGMENSQRESRKEVKVCVCIRVSGKKVLTKA